MRYYAGAKDIAALSILIATANQLIAWAEDAQRSAQGVMASTGPDAKNDSQANYDHYLGGVLKLSEDLHVAATKLP